jgi:hypothetical protein
LLRDETDEAPFLCPVNASSLTTRACGELGYMHPYGNGRGNELKPAARAPARATSEPNRGVEPWGRIVFAELLARKLRRQQLLLKAAAAR